MKRSELLFTAALVPLDYLMMLLAAAAAYSVRFLDIFTSIRAVEFEISLGEFLWLIAPLLPVALIVFGLIGFYRIGRHERVADDLVKALIGMSVAVTLFVFYVFFFRESYESRFLVIAVWLFAILLVPFGRFLLRRVRILLYKQGRGLHRVVLIGSGKTRDRLHDFYTNQSFGHTIVAEFETVQEGAFRKLRQLAKRPGVDEVVVASTSLERKALYELHRLAEELKWEFTVVPDLFGTLSPNFEIHDLAGIPMFELRRTPLEGWWRILKRLIDILGAAFLLVLLSPLFLLTAIAIKIDSRGPVFVRLRRVNRNGEFMLVKFRSMVKDAHKMKKELEQLNEREGPLFKLTDDPRVTRVGTFLRSSRIDELPQLWNVIKGQMSLVGPRPHEPEEVAKYEPHHKRVLGINSGMTGLAQVSGSSDLDFEEEVRLDTYYMENWSLLMDLSILFRTIRVVLFRPYSS